MALDFGGLFQNNQMFREGFEIGDVGVWDGNKFVPQQKENLGYFFVDEFAGVIVDRELWSNALKVGSATTTEGSGYMQMNTGNTALSEASEAGKKLVSLETGKQIIITCRFYWETDTSVTDAMFSMGLFLDATHEITFYKDEGLTAAQWKFYTAGSGAFNTTSNITCSESAWHDLKLIIKGVVGAATPATYCYLDNVLIGTHYLVSQPTGVALFPDLYMYNTAINEDHFMRIEYFRITKENL